MRRWWAILLLSLISIPWNVSLFLLSPWGGARLAGAVERLFARTFRGELLVGEFRLDASGQLSASPVLLVDPHGEPATSVDLLHVRFSPLALLRGRLAIEELRIESPRVRIAADDPEGGLGGVFMPRAPPPRSPGEAEPAPPAAPLPLYLDALRLEDGAFVLDDAAGVHQVLAGEIAIFATGTWVEEVARLTLSLHAKAHRPVEAPLDLQLRAQLSGWDLLLLELSLTLGETALEGEGKGDIRELWGDVELRGHVGAAEARAFGIPLAGTLPFEGDFHLSRESRGDLRIEPPGGGRLELHVVSRDFLHYQGSMVLRHLDPGAVIEGAPRFKASGRGSLEAALVPEPRARLALDLDRSATLGPGRLRLGLDGEGANIEAFELDLPGARARAEGRLGREALELRLHLAIDDLATLLAALDASLDLDLFPLRGVGEADLLVEGGAADPRFELSGRFGSLEVGALGLRGLALEAEGRLAPPRGSLDASVDRLRLGEEALERLRLRARRAGEGPIRLELHADREEEEDAVLLRGELLPHGRRIQASLEAAVSGLGALWLDADLPIGDLRPTDPLHLDLRVDPLDLGRLGALAALDLPLAIVRSSLRLEGRARDPRLDFAVFASRLRPLPQGIELDAELRLAVAAGRGRARVRAWDGAGQDLLQAEGEAPVDLWRLARKPEQALDALLDAPDATASLRLRGIDLGLWARSFAPGIGGVAAAVLDLRGPLRSPLGEARVELAAHPLGPLPRLDLVLAATSTEEEVAVDILGSLANQAPLRLVARAGLPLAALFSPGPDTPIALYWILPTLDLGGIPLPEALRGSLATHGHLRGSPSSLHGRAVVDARGLAYGDLPLGDLALRLDLDPSPLLQFFAIDPRAGTLEARLRLEGGRLPPLRELHRLAASPWAMDLRAEAFSLRPLSLLPSLALADGELFADLSVQRMDAEFPTGRIEVQRAIVQPIGTLRYDRIGLRMRLAPDRIDLDLLEAHARQGLAVVRGEIVGSPRDFTFDLRLRSRDLPVGGTQGVAALVSTRGEVEGRFGEALEAEVLLSEATVNLPGIGGRQLHDLAPPEDVVLFEEERPEVGGGTPLPLRVELAVAEPVRLRGPDVAADVEVGLGLHSGPAEGLLANGAADVLRGRLSLFGRTFDVEPSRVQWIEAPLANPALDLRARFQTVGATAWIDVGGTARAPVVQLRADPPMSEGEIALLIASGGGQMEGLTPVEGEPVDGADPVLGAAASVFGAVAGDRVLQALGPGVPIDVLTVQAQEGRTLLQAGTRIGPRLFLGYARNLFPEPWENANEVRVRYQLSRPLAVESRYGDAGNGGVDLVWFEQFPTRAQIRARERAGEEGEEEAPVGRTACMEDVVACAP